jgi:hypothetical protein
MSKVIENHVFENFIFVDLKEKKKKDSRNRFFMLFGFSCLERSILHILHS